MIVFFSNLMLLDRPFYRVVFCLQVAFYGSALFAWMMEKWGKRFRYLFLPLYFCTVNLASLQAMGNLLKGKKLAVWETMRR
jgi:hypothetical protein